jgi:transcriptional regulator with XRE-family HTH domain
MITRLRDAREAAGFTQVDVAKALGRTQAWVSKCESGERRIDPIDLADFAALYDRKIKHFVKQHG